MHTLFHCIYTKNIAVFGRFVNLFFSETDLVHPAFGQQRRISNLSHSCKQI